MCEKKRANFDFRFGWIILLNALMCLIKSFTLHFCALITAEFLRLQFFFCILIQWHSSRFIWESMSEQLWINTVNWRKKKRNKIKKNHLSVELCSLRLFDSFHIFLFVLLFFFLFRRFWLNFYLACSKLWISAVEFMLKTYLSYNALVTTSRVKYSMCVTKTF